MESDENIQNTNVLSTLHAKWDNNIREPDVSWSFNSLQKTDDVQINRPCAQEYGSCDHTCFERLPVYRIISGVPKKAPSTRFRLPSSLPDWVDSCKRRHELLLAILLLSFSFFFVYNAFKQQEDYKDLFFLKKK